MGPAQLINEIDKVRPPYNISVLNCEAALFALEHEHEFAAQAAIIKQERKRLMIELRVLHNVCAYSSDANMVLIRVPDADKAFNGMKQHGVLVKNVSKMHSLLANCLRLTVGTPAENTQMLAALKASL
jgi:histidinol-phosphate aminotransferase